MPFLQNSKILINPTHDSCYCCLSCTWRAIEHEVVRDLGCLQTLGLTLFLDLNKIGKRTDFLFHAVQTNKVIQFSVWITLKRFIYNDRVFLFYLFCLLCSLFYCIFFLLIINKDSYYKQKYEGTNAKASTTFEHLAHGFLKAIHIHAILHLIIYYLGPVPRLWISGSRGLGLNTVLLAICSHIFIEPRFDVG